MALTGIRRPEGIQVRGLSTKGAVIAPGLPAGSAVFGAIDITSGQNQTTFFESTISVGGQIQQTSSSNLSANEYWIFATAAG